MKPRQSIRNFCVSAIFAICASNQSALAEPISLTSSNHRVGLLELYTSEGCSSCPPADRWVSSLKDDPRVWKDLVPIAFHVDYWDYIGWRDQFASTAFSRRQQEYARQGAIDSVYTPGFVYNGQEWRQWFARRLVDFPAADNVGILRLKIDNDQYAEVGFSPNKQPHGDLQVNIALLGFEIASQVAAGENSGRTLHHDFVVLALQRAPLAVKGSEYLGTVPLPTSQVKAGRYAIAAWVNSATDQRPLQAVGGWLPRSD